MNTLATEHLIQAILAGAIQQEVSVFLVDRQSRWLSVNTIEYYRLDLKYFCEFLDRRDITLVSGFRADDVRSYLIELANHRKPGRGPQRFRTIRAFLNWWGAETKSVGFGKARLQSGWFDEKGLPAEEN